MSWKTKKSGYRKAEVVDKRKAQLKGKKWKKDLGEKEHKWKKCTVLSQLLSLVQLFLLIFSCPFRPLPLWIASKYKWSLAVSSFIHFKHLRATGKHRSPAVHKFIWLHFIYRPVTPWSRCWKSLLDPPLGAPGNEEQLLSSLWYTFPSGARWRPPLRVRSFVMIRGSSGKSNHIIVFLNDYRVMSAGESYWNWSLSCRQVHGLGVKYDFSVNPLT